ncbi:MAG: hypothetical protein RIR79_2210 [Pseudomonadota bacterium]
MSRTQISLFKLLSISLSLGLSCTVYAQSGKLLLGVPFGEKLIMKTCPLNTDKAKEPCWIGSPFLYKPTGTKLGSIHLPNPDSRPEWAAHGMFEVSLDRQDKLQEIKVHLFSESDRHKIADSISQRFGSPHENQLRRTDVSWASWKSSEGSVEMRCKGECWIEFRTPSAQAAREAEQRDRELANAKRPKAP